MPIIPVFGNDFEVLRVSRENRWLLQKSLAVDAHGMPVRILVTAGTAADCSQASTLIEGLDAQYLLADKGYVSDALLTKLETSGMKAVIPPR
jgi:IS5 family transposase